jgi:hypothetical protein
MANPEETGRVRGAFDFQPCPNGRAGEAAHKKGRQLVPFPSDEMAAHVTTTRVNNSRYNEPDCGAPVEGQLLST